MRRFFTLFHCVHFVCVAKIYHIININSGTTAHFGPRPSSEAFAIRPYFLRHSSNVFPPTSWAVLHSTIKSTCTSLTKPAYSFQIYYNHEPILKYRSHTTTSSAMLLSVVAGYEVRVVLTEHTIQTKFHKSQ